MKTITYGTDSIVKGSKENRPFVSVSSKHGTFAFSKSLTALLDLENNKIVFKQDKEHPKNWYLQVDNTQQGLKARIKQYARIIQNVHIARVLYDSTGLDIKYRYKIPITPKMIDGMYALIIDESIPRPEPTGTKRKYIYHK